MSTKVKFLASELRPAAERMVETFAPFCERIEIAGSLRRGVPRVADVELVALPKRYRPIFGEDPRTMPSSALASYLDRLVKEQRILYKYLPDPKLWRWGERYRRFKFLDKDGNPLSFCVDLFMVLPPAQWGSLFVIRTGPEKFNKELMTLLLKSSWAQKDGALWKVDRDAATGRVLDYHYSVETPTEAAYFETLGLPFMPVGERTVANLRRLWYGKR